MNERIVIRAMAVLTWVGAALGIVNVILNTIAIRVYSRLRPRTFATYYLYICICVADIFNGFNSFVTFAIFRSGTTEHKQIMCDIIGPLACSTRLTLDLLTILSVGRMVAIAFPFHFRDLFSYMKCSVYVGVFVAFTIVQYLLVPLSGGRFVPLDSGWCASVVNNTDNNIMEATRICLEVAPLVVEVTICIGCFVTAMVTLRVDPEKQSLMSSTRERRKSIVTLNYMLVSFIFCFGPWTLLELLGTLKLMGINTGIYIGPDVKPTCATKVMYKLMLTGVFMNGVFNAIFLLRGAGKTKIREAFSSTTQFSITPFVKVQN